MKFTSIAIAACALSVRTSQACVISATAPTSTTPTHSGNTKTKTNPGNHKGNQRDPEEDGAGKEGHVVMGDFISPITNETANFLATNATDINEVDLGFSDSGECSDEALANAMIVKVAQARIISADKSSGWHFQAVNQIEDDEIPTVLSLANHIAGAESKYNLVAYFYDLQSDLVACAHLNKHDETTAAFYDDLFKSWGKKEVAAGGAEADAARLGSCDFSG